MRTTAIHIRANGGPEVLEVVNVELGEPALGELRIRQSAIGLNFSDIYQRRGAHAPYAPAPFSITQQGQPRKRRTDCCAPGSLGTVRWPLR